MTNTDDFITIYLNAETCADADIVTITGEHTTIDVEKNGVKKKVMNLPVTINDSKLIYSPNSKIIRMFRTAWGNDSKSWVGKKFQVKIKEIEIAGQDKKVVRPELIA